MIDFLNSNIIACIVYVCIHLFLIYNLHILRDINVFERKNESEKKEK